MTATANKLVGCHLNCERTCGPAMLNVGVVVEADTVTRTVTTPTCNKKFVSCKEMLYDPTERNILGMATKLFVELKLLRWVLMRARDLEVMLVPTPVALHCTDAHGLPACPVEKVGSMTMSLHELTCRGVDKDTEGVTGFTGAVTGTPELGPA